MIPHIFHRVIGKSSLSVIVILFYFDKIFPYLFNISRADGVIFFIFAAYRYSSEALFTLKIQTIIQITVCIHLCTLLFRIAMLLLYHIFDINAIVLI